MDRTSTTREVTGLFQQIASEHHEAFKTTGGKDPDWAIWYARKIAYPLSQLLALELAQADVVCLLMQAADEHAARAPERPWAEFYGELAVERFRSEPEEQLALYHFGHCPYCLRVRRVIEELAINVELRDILDNPEYRSELVAARGRSTVPVLRCTSKDQDRWMPESREIIRYLRKRFG